ncbi:MAG: DUF4097 family beta strand repeat-containing protein [Gemmatimonadota bacterium]|nr:DUF4097 family beta strand repeat-containing protein [Gemmatimonadota bacterium]
MIKTAVLAVSAITLFSMRPTLLPTHSLATPDSAATASDFHWSGTIPAGAWLRIRNLSGNVEVRRAQGTTVDVSATPEPTSDRWSFLSGPIEPVTFVTRNSGSDVVVCAVSKSVPDCAADDFNGPRNQMNWSPQPMRIVVQLPAGVSIQSGSMHGDLLIAGTRGAVVASTGHGQISVSDVSGTVSASSGHGDLKLSGIASQVKASTGHGDINVSANGPVQASTGHGDIVVALGATAAAGTGDMSFSTGHGNVSVRAPRDLRGTIDISTGNGQVSTDFPLTMSDEHNRSRPRSRPRSAHGTLGDNNRSVRMSSGHGDISLTND